MRSWSVTIGAVVVVAFVPLRADAQDVLSAKNFNQLLQIIRPTPAESLWMQVPWHIDPNEARKQAAAEGKPLYVWSMSAEPLGTC